MMTTQPIVAALMGGWELVVMLGLLLLLAVAVALVLGISRFIARAARKKNAEPPPVPPLSSTGQNPDRR